MRGFVLGQGFSAVEQLLQRERHGSTGGFVDQENQVTDFRCRCSVSFIRAATQLAGRFVHVGDFSLLVDADDRVADGRKGDGCPLPFGEQRVGDGLPFAQEAACTPDDAGEQDEKQEDFQMDQPVIDLVRGDAQTATEGVGRRAQNIVDAENLCGQIGQLFRIVWGFLVIFDDFLVKAFQFQHVFVGLAPGAEHFLQGRSASEIALYPDAVTNVGGRHADGQHVVAHLFDIVWGVGYDFPHVHEMPVNLDRRLVSLCRLRIAGMQIAQNLESGGFLVFRPEVLANTEAANAHHQVQRQDAHNGNQQKTQAERPDQLEQGDMLLSHDVCG